MTYRIEKYKFSTAQSMEEGAIVPWRGRGIGGRPTPRPSGRWRSSWTNTVARPGPQPSHGGYPSFTTNKPKPKPTITKKDKMGWKGKTAIGAALAVGGVLGGARELIRLPSSKSKRRHADSPGEVHRGWRPVREAAASNKPWYKREGAIKKALVGGGVGGVGGALVGGPIGAGIGGGVGAAAGFAANTQKGRKIATDTTKTLAGAAAGAKAASLLAPDPSKEGQRPGPMGDEIRVAKGAMKGAATVAGALIGGIGTRRAIKAAGNRELPHAHGVDMNDLVLNTIKTAKERMFSIGSHAVSSENEKK